MSLMFIFLMAIFFISNVYLYPDDQSFEKDLRARGFDNKLVRRGPIETKKEKRKKCYCPDDEILQCGSDGTIYKNDCYFRCNQRRDPYLRIVENKYCFDIDDELFLDYDSYENESGTNGFDRIGRRIDRNKNKKKNKKRKSCDCPDDDFPLCGSDGRTYKNDCYFRCNQRTDLHLRIVEDKYCFEIDEEVFLDADDDEC